VLYLRLAWRAVPPWRVVVDAAIADVHPVHNAIPHRRAALDDPPAHSGYAVTGAAAGTAYVG
jgi:hypothetical protein